MHFFRQSLISPLSYTCQDTILNNISLYSIDTIINEPIDSKDRKDLNKIYQQADIFVKRNSIVTINNKKQKKLLNSSLAIDRNLSRPLLGKQDPHSLLPLMGKQGALFQQIHPADVQKSHDDNIFDYRLHMKLGRGEQIFKVEQVKRKQKKKVIGKQCECCGRQFSKYHKCGHSICQRKCGKANLKKGQSRRDISSMYSDSKDENWSQQNYDEDKVMKAKNERKLGRNQQSSSSNRQGQNYGDPSQHLLLSIEKLITEKVLNNFSYRVLQIKQFQEEQQSVKDLMEQEKQFFEESFNQNKSNQLLYPEQINRSQQKLMKLPSLNQGKNQNKAILDKQIIDFQNVQVKKKNNENVYQIEQTPLIKQKEEQKIEIKMNQQQNIQKMEVQNQNDNQHQIQNIEGQQQGNQFPQKSQQQQQQRNIPKKDNLYKQNTNDNQNPITNNITSPINKNLLSQSSSSSEQNIDELIQDLPEQAKIPINDDEDQEDIQKDEDNNINAQNEDEDEKDSLPSFKSNQDSLDSQVDDIQQSNQKEQIQNNTKQFNSNNHPIKISKKLSKQLKIIEKQRLQSISKQKLKSDQIEQIEPNIQIQSIYQKEQSKSQQNQKQTNNKQNKKTGQGKGKGNGKGMGRGHGIFEELLEIQSEDSQLLKQDNEKQESGQLFEKMQQKPLNKSLNSMELQKINLGSKSSINYVPGTPRRKIPNMGMIIEQIKLQSIKVEEQKGLGRGKIFGRGMGVLQEMEQLVKEVDNDNLLLEDDGVKDNKRMQGNKRVREVQRKKRERVQGESIKEDDGLIDEGSSRIVIDKFDQLIEDDNEGMRVQNEVIGNDKQDKMLNKKIIDGQQQQIIDGQQQQIKMRGQQQMNVCQQGEGLQDQINYISYLNKKQTLLHPEQLSVRNFPSSDMDNLQIQILKQQDNNQNILLQQPIDQQQQQQLLQSVQQNNFIKERHQTIANQNQIVNQQQLQEIIDLQDHQEINNQPIDPSIDFS